jgi:hypothetical protein
VVAIEKHCTTLIGAADSHYLREHFSRKVDIVPVPGSASSVIVPVNVVQQIQESLEDSYEVTPDPDVLADLRKLFHNLTTSQGNSFRARVHCECAMIGYLQSLPPSNTPPMDYLGVSGLSCKACALYMKALNTTRTGDRYANFFTRGTHEKWYCLWGFPVSNRGVAETFCGLIETEIAKLLIVQERIIELSGTSTASSNSSEDGYRPEEDLVETEMELIRQAKSFDD